MTIRNNKEKTIVDRAEEVQKRYNLSELPDELMETDPVDLPIERDWGGLGERSGRAAYLARRPWLKDAKKPLLKDIGPQIASDGTRAGAIIEKILPQIETLKKNAEDFGERLAAFEEKTSDCGIVNCRLRLKGTLHLHENLGAR